MAHAVALRSPTLLSVTAERPRVFASSGLVRLQLCVLYSRGPAVVDFVVGRDFHLHVFCRPRI